MRYFRHFPLLLWAFFAFFSIVLLIVAYLIPSQRSVANYPISEQYKHMLVEDTANGIGMISVGEGNSWAQSFQKDIVLAMPTFTADQKSTFTDVANKLVLLQNAQTVDDKLNIYHSFENDIMPSLTI